MRSETFPQLERMLEMVRNVKETTVAEAKNSLDFGSRDIDSVVHVIRNGELVALMGCTPDRDTMLRLISLAIIGMSADEIAFSMEVCRSTVEDNPGTGERWKPGEMQEALEQQPDWLKADPSIVTESISTWFWNRAGDAEVAEQHYRYTSEGELGVIWGEPRLASDEEGGRVAGRVFEIVSLMWHETTMFEMVMKSYEGDLSALSEGEKWAHADIAVTRYAATIELPAYVALTCDDPESDRFRVLNSSGNVGLFMGPADKENE